MAECGNPNCGVSTGIHEEGGNCSGLTFGSGKLDTYGYWEHPCPTCARAWEKKYPEDGQCWPFALPAPTDECHKEREKSNENG